MRVDLHNFLRMKGVKEVARIPCPECKKTFTIGEGYVCESQYTRIDNQEAEMGFMVFCSDVCSLLWLTPTQCGGMQ